MGTWIDGRPVVGEKNWLLSPCGVFRSPIRRGGLLQVGYTNAGSRIASLTALTALRHCPRYSASALHAGVPGPFSDPSCDCSRRRWTVGWNWRDLMISARLFTGTRSPCSDRYRLMAYLNPPQVPAVVSRRVFLRGHG